MLKASAAATPEAQDAPLVVTGFGTPGSRIQFTRHGINVVLARSGGGKTSLCRLLAGLDPAGAARVSLHARDLNGVPTARRDVGLVFGEFVNYPSLTVAENIATPLRARGVAREERRTRVEEIARRLELTQFLDRLPEALSGGQQQRVALARSMVKQPAMLLLDEPLANLDYKLRERMERELRELFADTETIVVYTTSDPREALALADRLLLLRGGEPIAAGTPLELLRAPGSIAAADLLCDPGINVADAAREGAVLASVLSTPLPLPADAPAADHWQLAIRPDHLRLRSDAPATDPRITGRVQIAETTGSDTLVHLRVGELDWVAHLDGQHRFAPGVELELAVHPADVLRFPRLAESTD